MVLSSGLGRSRGGEAGLVLSFGIVTPLPGLTYAPFRRTILTSDKGRRGPIRIFDSTRQVRHADLFSALEFAYLA